MNRQMMRQRPGFGRGGNLGNTERLVSILGGLGLTLIAARRGGPLRRMAMSTAGLSLLSRGATGYCGMKAAMSGESSLGQGLAEQFRRVTSTLGAGGGGAAAIDSLESMYVMELQELHSAETQMISLLNEASEAVGEETVKSRLQSYALELESRLRELDRLLQSSGADPRRHPDQAMHALINEARKMLRVTGESVRDAAIVASLQRIIHYKIAGYGTIAAYAKSLGWTAEAQRFAGYADRDKAVDTELSDVSKSALNPRASMETSEAVQSSQSSQPQGRAH